MSAWSALPAAAATDDHLACFKVKAPAVFDRATVDLESVLPAFGLLGCTVKSKAAQLCVPVTKNVVTLEGGTPVVLDGDTQVYQRVCYKVKCDGFVASDVEVTDQFGTQTVTAKKIATICTPAVLGPEPTTTTSSSTTTSTTLADPCVDADMDTYGVDCAAGSDCNDGDANVNPGATDTCNSIDDDCDGNTDEDFPLLGGACATGVPGICATGTYSCSGSGTLTCAQTTMPATETCNGADDDCDGAIDESDPLAGSSCATGLGGSCATGITTCSSGALVCSPPAGSAETCNNTDDDCDGTIDESLMRSCYTGPGGTAGVGACHVGAQTCSAGSWGSSCPGEVVPSTDVCGDGIDNDCDGAVDEGC